MKVLIIGGSACGAKTAARLSRVAPKAKITILERGEDISYASCGFPFFIGKEVENRSSLTSVGFGPKRDASYFDNLFFTTVLTGHEALSVDREKKKVGAKILATGKTKTFSYDKLVLVTGATPIRPNIPGLEKPLPGVFALSSLKDNFAIDEYITSQNPKKAVIIGSGLIGTEMAEALKHRALDVTMIDALPLPLMSIAGEGFGLFVKKELEKNGVRFYGGEKLTGVKSDGERVTCVVTDKREIDADFVLLSIGVTPNVALGGSAGLSVGKKGLLVNQFLQTDDPDIYAGGDCAESLDVLTGKPRWQAMGSTANRHGRVIADHIAGAYREGDILSGRRFGGVEGTAVVRVFDLCLGKTGLSLHEAKDAGYEAIDVLTSNPDILSFMPGSTQMFINLVADEATRRVLGARILGPVGRGRIDKRLDVVATAAFGALTVDDLSDVDLAYAPPFSTALDPLTHAANTLRNKIDGIMTSCSPEELKKRYDGGDSNFVILDVRNAKELEASGKLRGELVNVPLVTLKERIAKEPDLLPRKNKDIVIVCRAAVRAWSAYSILARAGYDRRRMFVLEGGMSAWGYETA
ncbi:pyridine nucleotide-disulfide oxidoreductase [Synergistales bacterium]|nr:pyridine nucleotide-disulfide oxidoreductase [Synergistales bacterium]